MSDPSGSILVVDDKESLRNSLVEVPTYLRYRTRSTEDGIAALIEMRKEVPDILLSDLNMPNMSGLELLSMRSDTVGIPNFLVPPFAFGMMERCNVAFVRSTDKLITSVALRKKSQLTSGP